MVFTGSEILYTRTTYKAGFAKNKEKEGRRIPQIELDLPATDR
jgi:hypothetical protein